MLARRAYYLVKPLLPWSFRMAMRHRHSRGIVARSRDVWPIDEAAGKAPPHWPGWPEGKRFAFVLTHDVEGSKGCERVRQLMDAEMRLGFRSSFNFVPEGSYEVPAELREELVANGFEVGVHDLNHDGKLYASRSSFLKKAKRINQYLEEWKADGFRSAFMLHNLDWLQELNVLYDASTFDTDPFEPQPDGARTIFPFFFRRENASKGYVELPYTLVQDSTLFFVLREKSADTWKKKLDWIAASGGMALLNAHPDYMCFGGKRQPNEFPVEWYQEFLRSVKSKYEGQYWHALPREVAAFAQRHRDTLVRMPDSGDASTAVHSGLAARGRKIWIDLENTPHIPFFRPIMRELEKRGHTVVLTARDAYQTCEMADRYGLPYTKIGRHYGQNRFLKLLGLAVRSLQLIPFALKERPALGLNHGSRTQILACNLLRIPTVMLDDYEHSSTPPLVRPTWEIVPDVLPEDNLSCRRKERIRKYSGIKEDVYVPLFTPDPSICSALQLNGDIVVTVRPPATEAHYHNPEAETLFKSFMERVCRTPGVRAVLLPRNKGQEHEIRSSHPDWFASAKVVIPESVVDGLNLLWHSDLVVSGGGTMNREAAALGVPVYSIFRGKIGAVDEALQAQGRLTLIENVEQVGSRILLEHRPKEALPEKRERNALGDIVAHLEEVLRSVEADAEQ